MSWIRWRGVPLGDPIEIRRGDTLSLEVTGFGNISTRTNFWFTVKDDKDDTDAAADIQIDENTGLLYINGVAGAAGNGSIVVTDAVIGNFGVTLQPVETAKLSLVGSFWYDFQWIDNAGVVLSTESGPAKILGDVTRAVA